MRTLSQRVSPRHNRKRGFTLLEMVFVLALIGIAMGGVITFMVSSSSERVLKGAAKDVELLTQKARAIAILQQIPYAITVTEGRLRMGPLVEAGYSDRDLEDRQSYEQQLRESGATMPKFSPIRADLDLSQFAVSIRRWGGSQYQPMRRADPEVWRFDPNGLCEPIGLRLEYEDGWIEMEFHPLSASIREQFMEAR
jgi:prepilin-type N-terminal cleavage/methylation domain-containing protein